MTIAANVGCGRFLSSPGDREQHHGNHDGADQPGNLRLGARLLGDGCA